MIFSKTHGVYSRTAKLNDAKVRAIRKKYARGLRGSTEAIKDKISVAQWNKVGRKSAWKHVT